WVDDETFAVTALWHVGGHKAFVDFQNDVTADDIALSEREGFHSVEHLKRYTTLGMATDQGKMSNVNGLAIMAVLTGETIPATGTTRDRHFRRAPSWRGIPTSPADAVASLGAGTERGFRRDRRMAAGAIFSAAW